MRIKLALASLTTFLVLGCSAASASADPIPLTIAPYGSPTISKGDGQTTISVDPGPAGLDYQATLDPSQTYRLTVVGQQIQGSFVLRLNEDGVLRYLAAPNGPAVYRITGVTSFDALVYSDTSGSYAVQAMTLENCQSVCKSDTDLTAEVMAAVPELQRQLAADHYYAAAQLILGWAAPRIVWASGNPAPIDTSGLTASEIYYDYFQPGHGGVYCGGAAYFLSKLLDLFSIPNFELNFGTTADDLTHVTVIVPTIDFSGRVQYLIVDPTYHMTLSLINSGKPASIPVALELWRMGDTDRVIFQTRSLGERNILSDPQSNGKYVETQCSNLGVVAGCSFVDDMTLLAPYLTALGFQTGPAAYLQLLGTTNLFTPDALGVPAALQGMLATFKAAVAAGDNATHIAVPPLPPVSASPPQLLGPSTVGSALTATTGTWSAVDPVTSVSYQWFRCSAATTTCASIAGATSGQYQIQASDVGSELRATATAHNEDGDSAPAGTINSPLVTSPPPSPPVSPPPTLTGSSQPASAASPDQPALSTKTTANLPLRMSVRYVGRTLALKIRNLSSTKLVTTLYVRYQVTTGAGHASKHRARSFRIRSLTIAARAIRTIRLRIDDSDRPLGLEVSIDVDKS